MEGKIKKAASTLYSLFVLFLLVGLPPTAWAAPTITWSRESIARIMAPGFSGTEQVTFRSDTALSDVDLVVVPALQAYLTVSPAHFSLIKAQTPYSVTLTLQIPVDAQVNNWVEGTIHLVQGRKTIATPLELSLAIDVDAVRQADPDKIVVDGKAVYPSNEVLLVLAPGTGLADAQQLASSFNGTVVGFIPSLNLYQVLTQTSTVSGLDALIESLKTNAPPFLVGVTRNYVPEVPQTATASTDLENLDPTGSNLAIAYTSVNTQKAWGFLRRANTSKNDVVVGLIDTGVDLVDPVTHDRRPEFAGVNIGHTPSEAQEDLYQKDGNPCWGNGCGHGTEVAGIIGANNLSDPSLSDPRASNCHLNYQTGQMNGILSGIPDYFNLDTCQTRYTLEERSFYAKAPKFDKLFNNSEPLTWILALIDQVVNSGAKVVLLEIWYTKDNFKKDQERAGAVKFLIDKMNSFPDVLFVLPAGDSGVELSTVNSSDKDDEVKLEESCPDVPGCINLDNTITVGAFDPKNPENGPFLSNYGSAVEVSGPGKYIYAPEPPEAGDNNSLYTTNFGATSGAAPFVAGSAAAIEAIAPQFPNQLKQIIKNSADPLPTSDKPIGKRLDICRALKAGLNALDPSAPQLITPHDNVVIPLSASSGSSPEYVVYFNWSDVSADSCNTITGYDLYIRGGDQVYRFHQSHPGKSFTITSPSSLTGWTWLVTAVDEYEHRGTSVYGDFSLEAVTAAGVTTLPANAINVGTATLNGSGNPNGLATTAWFEWGTDPNLSAPNTTGAQSIGSGSTAVGFSANLYGLNPDTTYYFRAVTANSGGTSKGSILSFKTLAAVAPAVSTGVTTGVTSSETIFNGQLNPNGALSNGWFEYGTSSTLATYNSTPQQSVGSDNTSHPFSWSVSGLSPGVTYYYRAAGSNAGGTNRGSIASFVVASASGGVATGTATSLTSSSAVLNGTVNPAGSNGYIRFEYGTDATLSTFNYWGIVYVTADQTTQSFTASVGSLTTNTTYYCRIVFQDTGNGSAQYGNIVSFSTLASTETTLPPSSVTSSSAVLNGTVNPAGSNGYIRFEYGTDATLSTFNYWGIVYVTADQTTQSFTASVGSLATNTTYYCRIVFYNSGNGSTEYGNIVSFNTQ